MVIQTFEFSGFSFLESILILTAPLLSYYLPKTLQNLPIYKINNIYFGINLFGFLVPILISFKILYQGRVKKIKGLTGIAIITFFSYELSIYKPSVGVLLTSFYVIPITASLISIIFNSKDLRKIAPLAYVSGSFGVLIGADLLRINQILSFNQPEPIGMIIGGAGVLDAIFLVGIISVIMDFILIFLNPKCRKRFKENNFLF